MKRSLSLLAAGCLLTPSLAAQSFSILDSRPFLGANLPTGAQRDALTDAPMFGLQAGLELRPSLHLVATRALVPPPKVATMPKPR